LGRENEAGKKGLGTVQSEDRGKKQINIFGVKIDYRSGRSETGRNQLKKSLKKKRKRVLPNRGGVLSKTEDGFYVL